MDNNNTEGIPKPKQSQLLYAITLLQEQVETAVTVLNRTIESVKCALSKEISENQNKICAHLSDIDKRMSDAANNDGDRYVTVKEAAKMLSRSEFCIRQDINEGRIPAKKRGRGYVMVYRDIIEMINSNT